MSSKKFVRDFFNFSLASTTKNTKLSVLGKFCLFLYSMVRKIGTRNNFF